MAPWSWEQRMYRAVQSFVRQNVLDEDRVQLVKRALYFGQYRVALHFSPTVSNWTDYNDLHASIIGELKGRDYRMVTSAKAFFFNIYTNDSEVLHQLRLISESFDFSSIDVLDPSCWHIKHSRPKNKGRYYHKFTYRVRLSQASDLTPESYQGLMQGSWVCARNFFYCNEVRDLLMFKLMHSADILEVSERS